MLDVLHVICTWLHPGHLSVCVGDSSRRCEIVKKSQIAPLNVIIVIIISIAMEGGGGRARKRAGEGEKEVGREGQRDRQAERERRSMVSSGNAHIFAYFSGTTWLQEIVYLISTDCDFERAKATKIDERFPFLEYPLPGVRAISEKDSPRFIKSHLPFSLLPKQLEEKKPKVISCDVAVLIRIEVFRPGLRTGVSFLWLPISIGISFSQETHNCLSTDGPVSHSQQLPRHT